MAAKEFLSQALKLDQLINSKLEELNQCRRLAESINGSRLDERVCHSACVGQDMGGDCRGNGLQRS